MFRFYIALWIAKFLMCFKRSASSDLPGRVALKICPKYLNIISRPKLTVAVTGTNGKTATAALINDFLKYSGMTTSFNEWGGNLTAGIAVNLTRGVSAFNKPKTDCSVLEGDEMIMDTEVVPLKPDYILVTNIAKDDFQRNGHPHNTFDHIEKAMRLLGDQTTAILNANDPISSMLDEGGRRIFYSMGDLMQKAYACKNPDIAQCPMCGAPLKYEYRNYRSIGKYHCSRCDFHRPQADYSAEFVDVLRGTIEINGFEYPLISGSAYNAFNELSVIALLRDMGYRENEIAVFLKTVSITDKCESSVSVNGTEFKTYKVESGNSSGASTVMESVVTDNASKIIVLMIDKEKEEGLNNENTAWIYDTDFEVLNNPSVMGIVFGGQLRRELFIRLQMAGIHEDKIKMLDNEDDIPYAFNVNAIERVYILYDSTKETKAEAARNLMVNHAKEGR